MADKSEKLRISAGSGDRASAGPVELTGASCALSPGALDLLMPMGTIISETGHILHAGPTLQKVFGVTPLRGQRFLEVFELRRPGGITNVAALRSNVTKTLHLSFRKEPGSRFNPDYSPEPRF